MRFNGKDLWVWMFSQDSSIDELIARAKTGGTGVNIKVLDGPQYMANWDHHADAIDSPAKAAAVARRFEDAGVPVSFWSVPHGAGNVDAEAGAILETAGAWKPRAFYLDVEPFDGFWRGDPTEAGMLVKALKGMAGLTVIAAPDARPWNINPSMDAFCREADAIAPQSYWRTFDDPVHRRLYGQYGMVPADGQTWPDFVVASAYRAFAPYGKPVLPILQGDVNVDEMRQAVAAVRNAGGADKLQGLGYSVWRAGVTPQDVVTELAGWAPAGATGEEAPPDPCGLRAFVMEMRHEAVAAANDLDIGKLREIVAFYDKLGLR